MMVSRSSVVTALFLAGVLGAHGAAANAEGGAGSAQFAGPYIGIKAGHDNSNQTGIAYAASSGFYAGGEAGYNWALGGSMVLGAAVWADNHHNAVTGRDFGADLKLGQVWGSTLGYLKAGVAASSPGDRLHLGIGAEYKFLPNWGALLEATQDRQQSGFQTYTNRDVAVGVTYHF